MPETVEKEDARQRFIYGLGYCIAALLSTAIMLLVMWQLFAAGVMGGFNNPFILFIVYPTGLMMVAIVSIGLHELGHALAAWSVGMRVQSVLVSFLRFERNQRGIHVRLQKKHFPVSGYVVAMPVGHRQLSWRYAAFTLGGPLASLLAGAAALAVGLVVQVTHEPDVRNSIDWTVARVLLAPANWIVCWLNLVVLMNLFLYGFFALIPFRLCSFLTDGAILLNLMWAKWAQPGASVSRRMELALLAQSLMGTCASGVRPRDWDVSTMERMLALRDGYPEDVAANLAAYYFARDCNRIEQAGLFLDLAMAQKDQFPRRDREALLLEAAYYEARYHRNGAVARQLLSEAKPGHVEQQTRLRAESAVLFARGRLADAARKAEEGLRVVDNSSDRGGAIAERDWLEELLDAIHRQEDRNSKNEPPQAAEATSLTKPGDVS